MLVIWLSFSLSRSLYEPIFLHVGQTNSNNESVLNKTSIAVDISVDELALFTPSNSSNCLVSGSFAMHSMKQGLEATGASHVQFVALSSSASVLKAVVIG